MSDSARFVISGEFDSGKLLADVNATINAVNAILKKNMMAVGTGIGTAVGQSTAQAMQSSGVAPQVTKTKQSMKKINADIFTAMRRVLLWGIAARAVFTTVDDIRNAFRDLIKLNEILVNIQKIRPEGFATGRVETNILQMAREFGVAFQEIGETQRTFFQQGFKVNEVLALTRTQLLGVTAANLSSKESMEFLIGTMSIFGIEAEKSITILDKLQNVQANYAVTTQDLVDAVRRVGPVVEELGGDFDNLIGTITALKTITRKTGEYIGTALRTVYSRMLTITGENALRALQISVRETAGTFRPLHHIMNDIAKRWEELTTVQRNNLAFALGARRRYTEVISLFNNYGLALEAAETSSRSFGAALLAQEKEAQSYARQLARLRETMRGFGIEAAKEALFSLTGTQDMSAAIQRVSAAFMLWGKVIVSVGKDAKTLVTSLGALTATIVSLWGVARLSAALVAAGKGMHSLYISVRTLVPTMRALKAEAISTGGVLVVNGKTFQTAAVAATGFSAKVKGATASLRAFMIAAAPLIKKLLIIGIVTSAFMELSNRIRAAKTEIDDFSDTGLPDIASRLVGAIRPEDISTYSRIIQQYQELGGLDTERNLKRMQESLSDMGTSLRDLSAEKAIQEMNKFGIEVTNAKEAMEALDMVIGFQDMFKQGKGLQLQQLNENLQASINNLEQFSDRLHISQDQASTPAKFQVIFDSAAAGRSMEEYLRNLDIFYSETNKKAIRYNEMMSDEASAHQLPVTPLRAISKEQIDAQLDGLLEEIRKSPAVQNIHREGGLVGVRFVSILMEGIRGEFQKRTSGSDAFDPSDIIGIFKNVVQKTVAATDRIIEDLASQEPVNLLSLLVDTEMREEIGAIDSLRAAFERLQNLKTGLTSDLTKELAEMRGNFDKVSEGVLYFAKQLSPAYRSIMSFTENISGLADELSVAELKTQALGSSYLDLARTIFSNKIDEGLTALAKIKTIDIDKKEIQRQIENVQKLIDKSAGDPAMAERVGELDQRYVNLQQTLENLKADLSNIKGSKEEVIKKVVELISSYNELAKASIRISSSNQLVTATIDLFEQSLSSASDSIYNYGKAISSEIGSLRNMRFEIGFDFNDTIFRQIDAVYALEKRRLNEAYELRRQVLVQREKELDRYIELRSAYKGVTEQSLQQLVGSNKINANVAARYEAIKREKRVLEEKNKLNQELLDKGVQQKKNLELIRSQVSLINEEYRGLVSFANDFGSAIATSVVNFGDLIRKRAGGTEFLQTVSSAYYSHLERNVSKLVSDLILPRLTGNLEKEIKELEDQLEHEISELKYHEYGAILSDAIKSACDYGAGAFSDSIFSSLQDAKGLSFDVNSDEFLDALNRAITNSSSVFDSLIGPSDTIASASNTMQAAAEIFSDSADNVREALQGGSILSTGAAPEVKLDISDTESIVAGVELQDAMSIINNLFKEIPISFNSNEALTNLEQDILNSPPISVYAKIIPLLQDDILVDSPDRQITRNEVAIDAESLETELTDHGVFLIENTTALQNLTTSVYELINSFDPNNITSGSRRGGPQVIQESVGLDNLVNETQTANTILESIDKATRDTATSSQHQVDESRRSEIKNMRRQQNTEAALLSVAHIVGQSISKAIGGGGPGSQIGGGIGGAIGSKWGPWGSAAGNVLGSIIGGLFDRDKPKEQEQINTQRQLISNSDSNTKAIIRNTEAIIQNTQSFMFMKKLIQSPSGFVMPAYASMGGGGTVINVTVTGDDKSVEGKVYNAVSRAYSDSYRRLGRRG